MTENDDPLQFRLWYWELYKKQKAGTFDTDDTFNLLYICSELGKLGYITNEDESDWILPPDKPQDGD